MRAPRSCQKAGARWGRPGPGHTGHHVGIMIGAPAARPSSGGLDPAALPVPGDAGGLVKLWLSHSKGNAPKICAKMLLTCNRSWAVPRRCKSEFLYLLLTKQRCVCVCMLHSLGYAEDWEQPGPWGTWRGGRRLALPFNLKITAFDLRNKGSQGVGYVQPSPVAGLLQQALWA